MAILLSDKELTKLIGTVILNGDTSFIRPNSYILRLGQAGEFLNANKEFELGTKKKGIKVSPGHSVALTAFETIDFRRETLSSIYPDNDLHAIISPTTDLSREGIVAPSTHIDSGYFGTLNWTITNTSSEERRFLYKEKLFRMVIFKLEKDERPNKLYEGDYQGETGYVRSQRKGAPVGMKENEWEDALVEGGPEALLENLVKSGYPWHVLGAKLKEIDQQLKMVSDEYGDIHDTLKGLSGKINSLDEKYNNFSQQLSKTITETLTKETTSLQNRWLVGGGSIIAVLVGLILTITGNDNAFNFVKKNGTWIGLVIIVAGIIILYLISKRKSNKS
jgi:deoxycytidine triphosphate deaminase